MALLLGVSACGISDISSSVDNMKSQANEIVSSANNYANNTFESKVEEAISSVQTEVKDSNVSISKVNALKKANSYLNYSAFSYLGLIEQLEYEQFPHEDAVYGADNCGANWKEQALKKAKSYLDYSSFSYSGLVEQLEFEKFTSEEAKYAVDNCGADWNEQAAKKAQSYLEYSAFSRGGLIDQLKFEGFTDAQAEYGVNSVGL